MSLAYYFRSCVFYILLFFYASKALTYKKGIIAWRIGCILIVFDLILMFFISEPWENRTYTLLLSIFILIVMPLLSQKTTCVFCGRRTYWHTLYSNKCPHCGKKIL